MLWSILSPSARRRLGGLVLLLAISGTLEVVGLGSILPFIGLATSPERLPLADDLMARTGLSRDGLVMALGGAVIGALSLSNLVLWTTQWLTLTVANTQYRDLSVRLLTLYTQRPFAWFSRNNVSDLCQRVLAESNNVVAGVLMPLVNLAALALRVTVTIAFLIWLNPAVTGAVVVLFGLCYALVLAFIWRPLARAGESRLNAFKNMTVVASETLGGARDVRVYGRAPYFLRLFERAATDVVVPQVLRGLTGPSTRYSLETITIVGVVGLTGWLSLRAQASEALPLLALYALAGGRLIPTFQQSIYLLTDIRYYRPSLDRLLADLREVPAPVGTPEELGPFARSLRLDGVSFSYTGERPNLSGISLEIAKNSRVAFVGETGSGKSTLLDVLLGLLEPLEGKLAVDGQEVTPTRVASWQKRLGYVPQSIHLLDASVLENVAFGIEAERIDRAAVVEACRIARLQEFIEHELPQGYDTQIGERGSRLSGGQRQRLGIARALYHRPEVLVFDEATSALDNATETAVMEALEELQGTKTMIVVAHRLSSIWHFDRVFVLARGVLVGQGTVEELLESCPEFRRLAGS